MFCKKCGTALEDSVKICTNCGTAQEISFVAAPAIPEENRPLSAWAYFGLQILFSIPVVGFIFLIVFSCNSSNINRRNFARSYWCALLVIVILIVITVLLMLLYGFNVPINR